MLISPLHLFYSRKGILASATTATHRSYLIAFPMHSMAKCVAPFMHEKGKYEITRETKANRVSPMQDALNELGIDPRKYKLNYTYLDKPGYLSIAKKAIPGVPRCLMIERSLIDIITYPFVKNIGIVVPLEIVHEDDLIFVLESRLIEPDGHVELFRNDLEKMLEN